MAVPDMHTYYQAVHLGRLIDWCQHQDIKLWSQLEQDQSDIPLHRAPWCYQLLSGTIKRHPLIGPTTRICLSFHSVLSILPELTTIGEPTL